MNRTPHLFPVFLLLSGGCQDVEGHDHDHDHNHEHEVITTVQLSFAPQSGDAAMTYTWADAESGGNPAIDSIVLMNGEAYDVSVSFLNELEDPAEDITQEIADEADEHQVFFTGSGVQGPATGTNAAALVEHTYSDADDNGLPLGLENALSTLGTGSADLTLTLRHMPPEDGSAVKVDGLAESVALDGFGAIGGDNDVQVTFPIDVQ